MSVTDTSAASAISVHAASAVSAGNADRAAKAKQTRDQSLAQIWSTAFHAHGDRLDGIFYPSRLNEERCIALYDRAVGKLKAEAAPQVLECRSELASTLDDLEIAIV